MKDGSFIYSTLDTTINEIRLLTLHPRSRSDPDLIRCELHHENLHHVNRRYEVLSYEWGVPGVDHPGYHFEVLPSAKRSNISTPKFSVVVSGHVMTIGANLWWALHHIQTDETRDIWVDALCINQEDTEEKNQQVPLMGEIYRNAKRVVAWIGREYKYGRIKLNPTYPGITDEAIWRVIIHTDRTAIIKSREDIPPTQRERSCFTLGFKAMCSRSYWTRVWIIQEIVHPYALILQCGSLSLQWQILARFLEAPLLKYTHVARIYTIRKTHPNGTDLKTFHTLELMNIHRVAKSKDVRDRIFALHSLSLTCCCEAVPVDHAATSATVFKRALKHYYAAHHGRVKSPLRLPAIADAARGFGVILPPWRSARWFIMEEMVNYLPSAGYRVVVAFSHTTVKGRRRDGV